MKPHLSWNLLALLQDKNQLTVTVTRNIFSVRTGREWQIDTSTNLFLPCTLLFAINGSLIFMWLPCTYKQFGNLGVVMDDRGFDYVGCSALPVILWFKSHPKGHSRQSYAPGKTWYPEETWPQAVPCSLLTLVESLKCVSSKRGWICKAITPLKAHQHACLVGVTQLVLLSKWYFILSNMKLAQVRNFVLS